MDSEKFAWACAQAKNRQPGGGIGTLGEKTMHAALKHYFAPCTEEHEIHLGHYVADIVGENGIIEIQTRGFDRLLPKLKEFLAVARVTVVHPIPCEKRLFWLDPESGAVTGGRKSPKTGSACDAAYELYKIKPLLLHPNLSLCLVLVDVEEYRYLNGWSRDKKRGSTRCERIPTALRGEVWLQNRADYDQLVPQGLPVPFTVKEYRKAAHLGQAGAQRALNVLYFTGAVRRVGKRGNAYLYEQA